MIKHNNNNNNEIYIALNPNTRFAQCVFRRELKERRSVQVISPIGSLFHSFGAATDKARSP
jgi:hypothetical protein